MGRFSWAGRGRPNVIVVIVVVEGHVRLRFVTIFYVVIIVKW